jgi:putative transposase
MRRSKFSEAQIAFVLRPAEEGTSVEEVCRKSRGVELDFSRPGKPTDNAFTESFNGKFRAECLLAHWFLNLADTRRKCERWRRVYNDVRPHSAVGYETPSAQAKRSP